MSPEGEARQMLPPSVATFLVCREPTTDAPSARARWRPSRSSCAVRHAIVVAEPMRFGRLFLVGDAAHIVPPTGAKGLNLAASDVHYLFVGLREHYADKSMAGINAYSDRALARIWQAERFSWWMTNLMHRFPDTGEWGHKVQQAELAYIQRSTTASRSIAEQYVGLPY